MAPEPVVSVLDACILYPFHLRNVVVQAAVDRLFDARWTDDIHDEWIRSLAAAAPTIPEARLLATRALLEQALPAARITGHHRHITSIALPDPDDRHVVAAGIEARAALIVTWNLRDFPAAELKRFGLRRATPDTFLSQLYDERPDVMTASLANARRNLRVSQVSPQAFVGFLSGQRLARLAERARRRLSDL